MIPDDSARFAAVANVRQTLERSAADNRTQLYSQQNNPDTPCLSAVRETLKDTPEGRYQFQQYNTLYHQMMMPMLIGKIFPTGLLGLFCLLMIMLLISTDDSRIFNASSTLMQDVLLPFWKSRLSQKTHLLLLRLLTVGVAAFFFIVALFFAQLDYINMFTTIMCSLWLGGSRADHGLRIIQSFRQSDWCLVRDHFRVRDFVAGIDTATDLGSDCLSFSGKYGLDREYRYLSPDNFSTIHTVD